MQNIRIALRFTIFFIIIVLVFARKKAFMAVIWNISELLLDKKRFKGFYKRYPCEWSACVSNLASLLDLLNQFGEPGSFQVGFFRSEGGNLYRIGQTGVQHAVESRLYVYIDRGNQVVYPVTIGTKTQQADDINRCKTIITHFESEGQNEH